MTRQEIYNQCVQKIAKTDSLLIEAATGTGKTKISIDLVNHVIDQYCDRKPVSILLLVAKIIHKQTWKDEINKWGGIHHSNITMECYESLKKHQHKHYDIIIADEVHHLGSDLRRELLSKVHFQYFIGLSATVPRKLKAFFNYRYHAKIVSCGIREAIQDKVLPKPQIFLFPLLIDNRETTRTDRKLQKRNEQHLSGCKKQ